MTDHLPEPIADAVSRADKSWQLILREGLAALSRVDPAYLPTLAGEAYFPTEGRLFAAFRQPLQSVRYVLMGEGPYPREKSATGVCFMDGAVGSLWSEAGLSKQVNRATSLRNFMKMLLVADGRLSLGHTTASAMVQVSENARAPGSPLIQTLPELQDNLIQQGFLLLNAALVFRPHVPPVKEAKTWQPFQKTVLAALAAHAIERGEVPATLVLWGKIAEQLKHLSLDSRFPQLVAEHPYNLTFIGNSAMQALFGPMHLLQRAR